MEIKPKLPYPNVLSIEQCREWILYNVSHQYIGEKTPRKLIYHAYVNEKGKVREGQSEGDAPYCYTSLVPPNTFEDILSKCFPGLKRNKQSYSNLILKRRNNEQIWKKDVATHKADLLPYEQRKEVCRLWIDATCIRVVKTNTLSTIVYHSFIHSFSKHMYLNNAQVSVWKL